MEIKIEGIDELEKELTELDNKLKKLAGKNNIRMSKLFSPSFMKRYTIFSSIEDFFEESNWNVESRKDVEEIPEKEMDKFVEENTKFKSWDHMLSIATEEWIKKELS